MKVIPASVHFRANVGFSLSYVYVTAVSAMKNLATTYKSIARMYALTALVLCNLYYTIAVKIC